MRSEGDSKSIGSVNFPRWHYAMRCYALPGAISMDAVIWTAVHLLETSQRKWAGRRGRRLAFGRHCSVQGLLSVKAARSSTALVPMPSSASRLSTALHRQTLTRRAQSGRRTSQEHHGDEEGDDGDEMSWNWLTATRIPLAMAANTTHFNLW